MKKDESEKKATAGCLVVAALSFLVLGICQCREEWRREQEVKPPATAPLKNTVPVRQKTKTATSTFTPADDEETDGDPYDNPNFDDLIPGEEYDEEFVDRDEGDLVLYSSFFITSCKAFRKRAACAPSICV